MQIKTTPSTWPPSGERQKQSTNNGVKNDQLIRGANRAILAFASPGPGGSFSIAVNVGTNC